MNEDFDLTARDYNISNAEHDSETNRVIADLENELETSFSEDNNTITDAEWTEVTEEDNKLEKFEDVSILSDSELGDLVFGQVPNRSTFSIEEAAKGVAADENKLENVEIVREDIDDPRAIIRARKQEVFSRFSGTSWFDAVQQQDIIIAGIGGIGSWTALLTSRLNPKSITLYDGDEFELGNLSGQLCFSEFLGTNKAEAIHNFIQRASNYHSVSYLNEMYTEESDYSNIMICGFDNMTARKIFYDVWKKNNNGNPNSLFIDGRMTINVFQVFAISGIDDEAMLEYERDHLFGEGEAESPVCSMKQTSFMSSMIAGVINNVLVNFCNNLNEDNPPYRVPFYTEFNSAILNLEVK